ncbi:DUF2057 family protein [Vibrio sp. AK197]
MSVSGFKFINQTILTGCLFITSTAYASVTLNVPEEIDLNVVNLEKADVQGSLFDSTKTIELPNGTNQIAFRYIKTFLYRESSEKVHSPLIVMKFDASNQVLDFKLPEARDANMAEKQVKGFNWTLLDSNTDQAIDAVADEVKVTGVVFGKDFLDEVESYNKKGGKAAVGLTYVTIDNGQNQPSVTPKTPVNNPSAQPQSKPQVQSLSALQQQYLKMSQQDRKAFLQWAVSQ